MLSILEEAKLKQTVVSVFSDKTSPDSANVGRIVEFDENHVIISAISTDGRWDGYLLRKRSDIYKIEGASPYEQKIMLLNEKRGGTEKNNILQFGQSNGLFNEMLSVAFDKKAVGGFGVEDSEELIYGVVSIVEGMTLTISTINEFGINDGFTVIYKIGRASCRERVLRLV